MISVVSCCLAVNLFDFLILFLSVSYQLFIEEKNKLTCMKFNRD